MSEQSMVERVARALHETLSKTDPGWDCYALARIAIEAMREPTKAMVSAAYLDHSCDTTEISGEPNHDMVDLRDVWKTMIDAVLEKETA